MDINDEQFLLKESIQRVANGSYTGTKRHKDGIIFIWEQGTNPLETSGSEGPYTLPNRAALENIANRDKERYALIFGKLENNKFMIICLESQYSGVLQFASWSTKLPFKKLESSYRTKTFSALLPLLQFVRENMSPTGDILFDNDGPKISTEPNPWSMHKETYTNAEVQEIIEHFRNEMLETINQLTKRLLDRIER